MIFFTKIVTNSLSSIDIGSHLFAPLHYTYFPTLFLRNKHQEEVTRLYSTVI
jgi:hypothetical protein